MRHFCLWMIFCAVCVPVALAGRKTEQVRNTAVARSFFEDVLDQGRFDKYAESHATNFVGHGSTRDFSLAEDMALAKEERKALPDMHIVVNQTVAERDMVAVYWRASGTNTQEGMGFPATGKKISVPGMTLFRFRDGKISEEWSVYDMLSVLKQLGLYSPQQ
ncbi:MAG TPA: ester cyclase [Terriglobales bacterium]|nr:ester cyclase [Terriglobales bacterium]